MDGEGEEVGGQHSEMIWFQFVSVSGKWREQMISIFSLASGPTTGLPPITKKKKRYLAR